MIPDLLDAVATRFAKAVVIFLAIVVPLAAYGAYHLIRLLLETLS
jgi:hypothetical protein